MKFSLKTKLILLLVCIVVVVIAVAGIFSYSNLTRINNAMYARMAVDLAGTGAAMVDPDELKEVHDSVMKIWDSIPEKERVSTKDWGSDAFNAYLKNYESVSELASFKHIQEQLRLIQDNNNLKYMYVVIFDPRTEDTIYLVDASYGEDECKPGAFDDVMYDVDHNAMKNPSEGIVIDITNTDEYGWVAAAGSAVFAGDDLVGFVASELDMNNVMAQRNRFLLTAFAALLVLAFVAVVVSIILVDKMIINPINQLSDTSIKYWSGDADEVRHEFSEMSIKTGDEIETLANSMKQMEQNINDHITKILETTQAMLEAKEHADEMDKAANIDTLTKVRNSRAYALEMTRLDEDIAAGNADFGIVMIDLNYLKQTNDTYGHDKGNESLRILCRIVCHVFSHSPVFRIGGDEFVVILKGNDLENVDLLMEDFDNRLAECQNAENPWEKISAAKGMSLFDPATDVSAKDVFRRADETMYENKKAMKAVRKN